MSEIYKALVDSPKLFRKSHRNPGEGERGGSARYDSLLIHLFFTITSVNSNFSLCFLKIFLKTEKAVETPVI